MDGRSISYLGREGSGEAQILQDNTAQNLQNYSKLVQLDRRAAASAAAKNSAKGKKLTDWSVPVKGWDTDVKAELLQDRGNFERLVIDTYKSGVRPGDQTPEGIEAYKKINQAKEDLVYKQQLSADQQQAYQDALKIISTDKDGIYDQEKTNEQLTKYRGMSIDERSEFDEPLLVIADINDAELAEKTVSQIKENQREMGTYNAGNGRIGTNYELFRDPEQVLTNANATWETNARLRAKYESQGKTKEDWIDLVSQKAKPREKQVLTNEPSTYVTGQQKQQKIDNLYDFAQRVYEKDPEALKRFEGISEDGTHAITAKYDREGGKNYVIITQRKANDKKDLGTGKYPSQKDIKIDISTEDGFSRIIDLIKTLKSSSYGTIDTEDVRKVKEQKGLKINNEPSKYSLEYLMQRVGLKGPLGFGSSPASEKKESTPKEPETINYKDSVKTESGEINWGLIN